jgi:hypothetical protein
LKQDLQGALGKIKGSIVESLITSLMRDATKLGKVYYGKELKAMAERSGKARPQKSEFKIFAGSLYRAIKLSFVK